jgi:cell division protein FtsL
MYSKLSMYLILISCFIAGMALFRIKDNVLMLNGELTEVQKQISDEQDNIRILKAEFAYLTAPERLRLLSEQYLHLKGVELNQMLSYSDFCLEEEQVKVVKPFSNHKLSNHQVKWRYKKGPKKYLTMVVDKR